MTTYTDTNNPTRHLPRAGAEPAAPWDRHQMSTALVRLVRAQPRIPLGRAEQLPDVPGVYLAFLQGPLPQYGDFQLGSMPIYGGKSEDSVRDRATWHLGHIVRGIVGLTVDNLWVLALPLHPVDAVMAERLLLDRFDPPWNRLGGFGARRRGKVRQDGRSSSWNAVHPGGYELPPTRSERLIGTMKLAGILVSHQAPKALWSPLWTPPAAHPRRSKP